MLALEVVSLFLVIAAQLLAARFLQSYEFFSNGSPRWLAIAFSLAPVLFAYAAARVVLPPLLSALLVAAACAVLSIASATKLSLTNEPLSWTDLSAVGNISVAGRYLASTDVWIIGGFTFAALLALRVDPFRRLSFRAVCTRAAVCLAVAPLPLYPYLDVVHDDVALTASSFVRQAGISYVVWDWSANVRQNGLPLHLVQTSRRTVPRDAGSAEREEFLRLAAGPVGRIDRPSNVIFILCESCWHDAHHFRGAFGGLENSGFRHFRAISPVYGGATVNASFELLTGLPSGGQLNGVVYQEYAPLIAERAHTYPRSLADVGYRAIAAHNHYRAMWRRDVVLRKFGFERFISREDMPAAGDAFWADDRVLFDAALEFLRRSGSGNFLFLTTVYTHGPYRFAGDGDVGEGDYRRRLDVTLDRLVSFVREVRVLAPDSLILVVGDHKPSLARYFFEQGILPPSEFESTGETNEDFRFRSESSRALRGDVPAYVFHRDARRVARLIEKAEGRPFFCLSQLVDEAFTGVDLPAFAFAAGRSICSDFRADRYDQAGEAFPSWLYALSLFDEDGATRRARHPVRAGIAR